MRHFILSVVFFIAASSFQQIFAEKHPAKILICGVCKDVEKTFEKTIENIEKLGNCFSDYEVIIYENNSNDKTAKKFAEWAKKNEHVLFLTEVLSPREIPKTRVERIARARNIVLSQARDSKYDDFEYLVMADLDFNAEWPIVEILETIDDPREWDVVSSNGIKANGKYYDLFAFRNEKFPFGPELISYSAFWESFRNVSLIFKPNEEWIPVYSAFGGLAIYKTRVITQFGYSGLETADLKAFYREILFSLSETNPHLQTYIRINHIKRPWDRARIPIIFQNITNATGFCCEHVPLHASMKVHGFGKFYINPKMIMRY